MQEAVDGTVPAKRIHDYTYSQTQRAAFCDENDIPFGRVLQTHIQSLQTAAMTAIRSAKPA